jgi:hypothetical protein
MMTIFENLITKAVGELFSSKSLFLNTKGYEEVLGVAPTDVRFFLSSCL